METSTLSVYQWWPERLGKPLYNRNVMGTEAGSIAGEIDRSWRGEAWSGPALREILADVDEAAASWKPDDGIHSTWELLLHASCWERVVRDRVNGSETTPSD